MKKFLFTLNITEVESGAQLNVGTSPGKPLEAAEIKLMFLDTLAIIVEFFNS